MSEDNNQTISQGSQRRQIAVIRCLFDVLLLAYFRISKQDTSAIQITIDIIIITMQQKKSSQKVPKNPTQPQQTIPAVPSPFQSNLQQIKTVICRCYTIIRIIALVPLSVISRIGGIYFLVQILTSSEEKFDSWWKMLSLIGYIFYFTVGSILFFLIAPQLEIQVGRKQKSYGFFGGIFGELKGLVFRNRYQLPLTIYHDSQKEQQKQEIQQKDKGIEPSKQKPSMEQQNKSSMIMMQEINMKIQKKPRKQRLHQIKIKEESSIEKCKKKHEQTKKAIQIERKMLRMKQEQRKQEQKNENLEYKNLSSLTSQNSTQLLKLKQLHQTSKRRREDQKIRQEQLQQQLNKKQKVAKQQISKTIQFQKQIDNYNHRWQFIQEKYIAKANSVKLQKSYSQNYIIQSYMDRYLSSLGKQISFNRRGSNQYFYIMQEECMQYRLLEYQLQFLSQNQKQGIISHILFKKQLKQLNKIQVKQKKFYLFLFNLLDATDAMIAWYDYYQLPDRQKFKKFQTSYYFLILCFEQIPQIIAQGCSLKFVFQNKFNIAIFCISMLKLIACTIFKLYIFLKEQNIQTQPQKQKREFELRMKKYEDDRNFRKSMNNVMKKFGAQMAICCLCCPCIFLSYIVVNILPIVNRILLYIFLGQVRNYDEMMYWVSIICLVYYFIVGNSLSIIAFDMPEDDRKKYHNLIFTCVPVRWMKLFVSVILILLNSLNICLLRSLFQKILNNLYEKSKVLSSKLRILNYKLIYIYFAFEGIPFIIIYSLTLSRSTLEDNTFNIIVLVFGCVNVVCLFAWFLYQKNTYRTQDQILNVIKERRESIIQ